MQVISVNVGQVRQVAIQGRKVTTAIGKHAVDGRIAVQPLGLVGDEQADLTVHGGLGKAVYAYPHEHYAFWQRVRAQAGATATADNNGPRDRTLPLWDAGAPALAPGAVGENLTLTGLLERDVWVGDLLRFPDCALAVSEPRLPCFKFNAAMGFPHAAKLMTQSGWCGFYLAVRVPGTLAADEAFELVPGPREVSIPELFSAQTAPKRR